MSRAWFFVVYLLHQSIKKIETMKIDVGTILKLKDSKGNFVTSFKVIKIIPKIKEDIFGLSEICYDGILDSGNEVRIGQKELLKHI